MTTPFNETGRPLGCPAEEAGQSWLHSRSWIPAHHLGSLSPFLQLVGVGQYGRAPYFKAAIYYIHVNPNFPKDIHSHQALLYKYTLHIKSRLPALSKPLSQQALKSLCKFHLPDFSSHLKPAHLSPSLSFPEVLEGKCGPCGGFRQSHKARENILELPIFLMPYIYEKDAQRGLTDGCATPRVQVWGM